MKNKRESKAERQMLETCEIIAALAAYQEGGDDKDTIVHRIRVFSGVTMEAAARYYEAFEEDGIYPWRYKAIESVMQTIGRNDKQQRQQTERENKHGDNEDNGQERNRDTD